MTSPSGTRTFGNWKKKWASCLNSYALLSRSLADLNAQPHTTDVRRSDHGNSRCHMSHHSICHQAATATLVWQVCSRISDQRSTTSISISISIGISMAGHGQWRFGGSLSFGSLTLALLAPRCKAPYSTYVQLTPRGRGKMQANSMYICICINAAMLGGPKNQAQYIR